MKSTLAMDGRCTLLPSFLPSLSINSPIALSLTGWMPIITPSLGNRYVFPVLSSNNYPFSTLISFSAILHQYPPHYPYSLFHSLLLRSHSFQPSLPPRFVLLLDILGVFLLILATAGRPVSIPLLHLQVKFFFIGRYIWI